MAQRRRSTGSRTSGRSTHSRSTSRGRAARGQSANQNQTVIFVGIGVVLLIGLIVVMSGGGDKKPTNTGVTPKKTTNSSTPVKKDEEPERKPRLPPGEVPKEFSAKVNEAWPKLLEKAKKAHAHFTQMLKHKTANQRDQMSAEGEKARKLYDSIITEWSALVYSIDDYDEPAQRACQAWVSKKERRVREWNKKFKEVQQHMVHSDE